MAFKDCDDAMGAGLFFRLSQNMEAATLILLGEPFPRQSEYKKQKRTQYCFPVFGPEGPQIWTTGVGTYIDLRDSWDDYRKGAVRVTRHGKPNDKRTRYEVKAVAVPKKLAAAFKATDAEELSGLMEAVEGVAEEDDGDGIPI